MEPPNSPGKSGDDRHLLPYQHAPSAKQQVLVGGFVPIDRITTLLTVLIIDYAQSAFSGILETQCSGLSACTAEATGTGAGICKNMAYSDSVALK